MLHLSFIASAIKNQPTLGKPHTWKHVRILRSFVSRFCKKDYYLNWKSSGKAREKLVLLTSAEAILSVKTWREVYSGHAVPQYNWLSRPPLTQQNAKQKLQQRKRNFKSTWWWCIVQRIRNFMNWKHTHMLDSRFESDECTLCWGPIPIKQSLAEHVHRKDILDFGKSCCQKKEKKSVDASLRSSSKIRNDGVESWKLC